MAQTDWQKIEKSLTFGSVTSESIPVISLDIPFKSLKKLEKLKILGASMETREQSKKYVKATMRANKKAFKVKIRLKGDKADHFGKYDGKYSYRVKINDENIFMGMKEFSIQDPRTRKGIGEWIYHKLSKKEGLISPNYLFVKVVINGKEAGVFSLEESFSKYLLERYKKKEAPILRFKEDFFWEQDGVRAFSKYDDIDILSGSKIVAFDQKKILRDSGQAGMFKTGSRMLYDFLEGKAKAWEVFDIKKLARHFAVIDLLGGSHAARWHNLRFYFNPLVGRLEPISFDAQITGRISFLSFESIDRSIRNYSGIWLNDLFYKNIFKDEKFRKEYFSTLKRISSEKYFLGFIKRYEPEILELINLLTSEIGEVGVDFQEIKSNIIRIRTIIEPQNALSVYLSNKTDKVLSLKIGNRQSLPLEVVKVKVGSKEIYPFQKTTIKGKEFLTLTKFRSVDFDYSGILEKETPKEIEIFYRQKWLGKVISSKEKIWPDPAGKDKEIVHDKSHKPWKELSFLTLNKKTKEIVVKKGKHTLNRLLIVPENYTLNIYPFTELDFVSGGGILSFGGLRFQGSPDGMIKIHSSDKKGRGISVINSKEESVLDFVSINNLSSIKSNGVIHSGALTFYQSNLKLSNSFVSSNLNSDDSINVIRSNCLIEETEFKDAFADAIDLDFSNCKVSDIRIINPGNDGLDVSGGKSAVYNLEVVGAKDKGISAGEEASLYVFGAKISSSRIALASKDLSKVILNEKIFFEMNKIGIAAYQKKESFGHGEVYIKAIKFTSKNERNFLVEEKSFYELNNKRYMGKLSGLAARLE